MNAGRKLLAALSAAALLLPGAARAQAARYYSPNGYFLTQGPAEGFSDALGQELIAEVNADRLRYGLGTLREDAALSRAAQTRAKEIARHFSHTRPDGTSWSSVYSGAYAENIARGYATAYKCQAALMSSAGHRANVLRAHYTKIGTCAYTVNGVTYWVQLFGR
ncbi:MAG: CAP domain-containing protein [Eubacteriales bacterium]|nr:CAP domain-containing protein [Eubacteriales bacterium]